MILTLRGGLLTFLANLALCVAKALDKLVVIRQNAPEAEIC